MRELTRRSAPVLLAAVLAVLAAAGPLGAQGDASEQGPAPLADAELAFTRGVLAYHDGDLAAAREHFEEALRLAPGDPDARKWLELTRRHIDRPAEAALAPRPEWAGDFAVLPEAPRFEGRLYVGVGADSNPNLMPDDLVLATPGGEAVDGAEEDTLLLADARVALQAVDQEAGRAYGVVLRGGQALHDEFDYLDLGRLEAVAHLALGEDPLGYLTGPFGYARAPFGRSRFALLVQAGAAKDWLDGEGFADRLLAGAALAMNEAGWGQTRIELSYRDSDFDGDPSGGLGELLGRSGDELRGELAQVFFFGRRNRYLRLGVAAGERDAGAAFDASSVEALAEASLPLAARWTFYLDGAFRRDDYDERVSNLFNPGGDPREDEERRLGGSLLFRATERLFVSGRAAWIDHEIDMPGGFSTPDLSY
ncbi:MAG TPA: tetratricopeptide repeat protein, partial [Thermoanaerobaculia bacterium]|nr:tetratricopeptide repeat protein [Thermoanaerobaculia bacterium]